MQSKFKKRQTWVEVDYRGEIRRRFDQWDFDLPVIPGAGQVHRSGRMIMPFEHNGIFVALEEVHGRVEFLFYLHLDRDPIVGGGVCRRADRQSNAATMRPKSLRSIAGPFAFVEISLIVAHEEWCGRVDYSTKYEHQPRL